jgi:two-component system OmpR family response regulator
MSGPTLRRILLVEDDPDIRFVATMALESVGGFTVLTCRSGDQAVTRFEDFVPDLVLLDVMMPGMDGLETLAALRRLPGGGEVPVVFMTARVQVHEVAAYRALGAADVIAKPFDPMALSETVKGIWQGLFARSAAGDETGDLRRYFTGRLPGRIAEILAARDAARAAGWAAEPLRTFHRLTHSLAGAGATFGFPEVSDVARRLERGLRAALDAGEPPREMEAAGWEEALEELRRMAETAV